jgi:molecular chaperone GrpE
MSKVKNLKKLSNLKNGHKQTNVKADKNMSKIEAQEDIIKTETVVSNDDLEVHSDDQSNSSLDTEIAQIEILKTQLKSKEEESKDWQSKAFRYVADLENYKKQQELELGQVKKNTKKNAIKPLLEYLNNQYLSLNFIKDITDEKSLKAFAAFNTSFEKIINEYKLQGVDLILPQPGDTFDPVTMQALAPTEDEDAKVKHVVSLGLKVDNQLIQPVMVVL